MIQEEVDLVYNITIVLHENPWFRKRIRTRDEVQEWVRLQLGEAGVHTIPVGSSWGALVGKTNYEEYNKKHPKL